MADHKISFEVQSLLDVFSKTVFKNPEEDVIRELLTNAQDACILRTVEEPGFDSPIIGVSVEEERFVLKVKDNGTGMTEEDLRKHFATLGSSSFKRRASSSPVQMERLLGSYGMGTISYFIVAEEIEVVTRSLKPGSRAIRWIFNGGDAFQTEPAEHAEIGTTVSLRLKRKYAGLASKARVLSILEHLAPHLEIPLIFEGQRIAGTGRFSRRSIDETNPLMPMETAYARARDDGTPVDNEQIGVLRFDVSGNWSARDFAGCLDDLQSAYIRLSAFLLASVHDPEIMEAAARPYIGTVMTIEKRNEFQSVIRLTE